MKGRREEKKRRDGGERREEGKKREIGGLGREKEEMEGKEEKGG